MSYHSKLIKAICTMDRNEIKISPSSLAEQLNITDSEASINLTTFIEEGYLINTTSSFKDPFGHIMTIHGSYNLTSKARDYKTVTIKNSFLKWYPIIISTIALLVSILVAIYK